MSSTMADNSISDVEERTFHKDRTAAVFLIVFAASVLATDLRLIATTDFSEMLFEADFPIVCIGIIELLMLFALPFMFGWVAIAHLSSRLTVSPGLISYLGLFVKRNISIDDVISVDYVSKADEGGPLAAAKIVTRTSKLKLSLSDFEKADQEKIANRIHNLVAPERQNSFEDFLSTWRKSKEEFESSRPGLFLCVLIGLSLITILDFFTLCMLGFLTIPLMFLLAWIAWKEQVFRKKAPQEATNS